MDCFAKQAYIVSGGASFGSGSPIDKFHCVVLSAGADETGVEIVAQQDNTELVLISGEPLDQEIVRTSSLFSLLLITSRPKTTLTGRAQSTAHL
jgi:hypothetical protein